MAGDFPRMQPVKLEGLFELQDPVDLEDLVAAATIGGSVLV